MVMKLSDYVIDFLVNEGISHIFELTGEANTHLLDSTFGRDILSVYQFTINKNTITIKGNGRPYRSYMYTADLMCWLWTILLNGKADEAYNVGSEDAMSIAELAKIVSECCAPAVKYEILRKPDFNIPAPQYVPNTRKAQRELGLKQTYLLPDSIKRTIQWANQSLIQ